MKTIYKYLIFSLFITILSCGRKGDPLPPISKKPIYINSLNLKQQGNYIVVYWRYIPKYDDNRPLKIFSYKVFLNGEVVKPKIYKKENLYWFNFRIPNFKKEYCFNIYVISKDEESENSPIECIIPSKDFPKKPKLFGLEMKEEGILLKWEGEGKLIDIYRSDDINIPPISVRKIKNTGKYLDRNLTFNKKYCYYITSENDKEIESNKSNTICKRYIDVFPPKAPSDFKLLKKGDNYYLIWKESQSKDVVGYIIYKNGKPLFNIPIKTYYFIDKSYKNGDTYFIIAVDRAGNKSKKVYLKEFIK